MPAFRAVALAVPGACAGIACGADAMSVQAEDRRKNSRRFINGLL
jgi:hypothetical protein